MFAGAINYSDVVSQNQKLRAELGRRIQGQRGVAENRQLEQLSTSSTCPSSAPGPRSRPSVGALADELRGDGRYFEGWRQRRHGGMPVVANGGLVGIVTATTPHGATVRLISDVKSLIGVTFGSGNTSIVVSGQGVNNGLGATSVPLTSSVRAGTVLSTNGLDAALPAGIAGRQSLEGHPHAGAATYNLSRTR